MVSLPRDRKSQVRWGLIVALLVAAYFLYKEFFPEIDPEQVLEAVSDTLGQWTYPLVAFLAFGETGAFIGLVFPGETAVIVAGAVAGQGVTNVVITLALVWFSAWLGDSASFFLGSKLGREFIYKHGPRVRITHERFHQVEGYFQRHGGKTILVGRFIGLVRALAPFIAGSSGMRYRDFVPYSILGTGLWSATFTLLGYALSRNIDQATKIAGQGIIAFGLLVALFVGGYVAARFLRERENRERLVRGMEERAALRPLVALGRRLAGPSRFVRERLTPGGLGLELTSLVAALAVSGFIVVGYISIFSTDLGPTPGDQIASDVAGQLQRSELLVDVAKVLTQLGSGVVAIGVAIVAAAFLVWKRWYVDAVVLVSGAVLISVLVTPELKDLVARPRPDGGLIDAPGFAWPSGHSANAVVYTALGIVLAYRAVAGPARRSLFVITGVVLTGLVGSTRILLGVHWGSDVGGGFAEGAFVYAVLAMVAMTVLHLRQNSPA